VLKTALIIEDENEELLEIAAVVESHPSWQPIKSKHGEEGLSILRTQKPKLVILDIMLPEIDGFEICKKIQEIPSENRPWIILLTSLTPLLDKMESDWMYSTGANALLTKPLDKHELLKQLDRFDKK